MQREPIAKRRALFVYTFSPLSRKSPHSPVKKKCEILLHFKVRSLRSRWGRISKVHSFYSRVIYKVLTPFAC